MTSPAFADPADAAAFAMYQQARLVEYGTWVAAVDIPVGAVIGFAAGHPVPKSTVEAQGWEAAGLVVRAAPLPPADRAAQLKARREQLAAEQAAIDAELAEEPDVDDPKVPPGYTHLKVDELRAELAARGLPTSGTKDELVARLTDSDEE